VHEINGKPDNLSILPLKYGAVGNQLESLEKLLKKREQTKIDYIVAVDQIYDQRTF